MNGMIRFGVASAIGCSLGWLSPARAQTNVLSMYHAAELEYEMTNGALYQLQATDNLPGPWLNAGPAIVGEENCSESFFQTTRNADRKFWRVIEGSASNVLDFSQARSLSSTNYVMFENVLWRGTNWIVSYRVGSVFHREEATPLRTLHIPTAYSNAPIVIDGNSEDWNTIPVVYADAQHDQEPPDNHPGTDVQQYKIARDATYIYMAYWLYDANPDTDGTAYHTEFQQYYNQYHTAGDTMITALCVGGAWQVQVGYRESQQPSVVHGADHVGVGMKFIEYKIPIADVEYDGLGLFQKRGIETRFLRTYVHYAPGGDVNHPSATYDGAGEDDRFLIVMFY